MWPHILNNFGYDWPVGILALTLFLYSIYVWLIFNDQREKINNITKIANYLIQKINYHLKNHRAVDKLCQEWNLALYEFPLLKGYEAFDSTQQFLIGGNIIGYILFVQSCLSIRSTNFMIWCLLSIACLTYFAVCTQLKLSCALNAVKRETQIRYEFALRIRLDVGNINSSCFYDENEHIKNEQISMWDFANSMRTYY